LSDNNLALTSHCPTEPEDPARAENETDAAFATREHDHATVRMKYDLDRAKWDSSNRKCLMVIKGSIEDPLGDQSQNVPPPLSISRRWRVSSLALQRLMQALLLRS